MSKLLTHHITYMRAAGHSAKTVHDRQRLLTVVDAALPHGIDAAGDLEIAEFLGRDGWSAWTHCTYYMHLAGFYRWACAMPNPYLDWNPMSKLKAPKAPVGTPDPVTDNELRIALDRSGELWRLVITLAAYAGLRRGDISRLRREDVSKTTLIVRHGKGDKSATLPTYPEIWRIVEPMPPGRLVLADAGTLSTAARRHFDKIGLPDVHLHRFRHWFATMLLRSGVDIRTVQTLMRHASLEQTARYLQITEEQRRLAICTLPLLHSSPLQDAA